MQDNDRPTAGPGAVQRPCRGDRTMRRFVENAPVAMAMFDRDMRYLATSRRWIEDYRLEGLDLPGRSHYEVFPEVPERWKAAHRRGLAGHVERSDEDRFERADGTVHWLRWELQPWWGPDGGVCGIVIFTEDTTGRKRGEEALRESETRFRATFEQAAVGIAHVAPDGRWLRVNQKLCEIVGYGRDELLGLTFQDLTHPDDLGADLEQVRLMLAGQIQTYSMPKRYFRKDGAIVWINLTVALVRTSAGDPDYFISVVEEITERKRSEERLLEREHLLSESQRIAHVGSWVWDLATNRGTWTDETYRVYGLSPDTLAPDAESFLGLIHPEDRASMQAWIEACTAGEEPADLEFRPVRPDGEVRVLSGRGALQRDREGRPVRLVGTVQDITERRRAQEALLRSEERFHQLSEATAEGIAIHEGGRILDVNQALTRMFGYELSEVIGMNALALAAAESRDLVRESILSGREVPYEAVGLRKDGSTFLGELVGKAMPYHGRMVRVTSIRDITARKQAEAALHESEARYRVLAEASQDLITMVNGQSEVEYTNTFAARHFGRSPQELIGKRLADLFPPEIAQRQQANLQRVFESRQPLHVEAPVVFGKDTMWLSTWLVPIHNDRKGATTSILVVSRDITERRRGEEALRESEARFRATFEQAAVGIVHVALDGRWLRVNQKLCDIVGYAHEELVGKSFQSITHPEDVDDDLEYVRQVLAGELETYSRDKRYVRRDGAIVWIHLTVALVRRPSGDPDYFISVVEDITERKRVEEERERLEEQFRQAQKMEAVGRLAGGVAHDFNNMLSVILGHAELALRSTTLPAPLEERLREIHAAAKRSAAITGQLLAFARRQTAAPRVLDLNDALAAMLKMLRRLIGEDIDLSMKPGANLWPVKVDPGQIDQILANLAVNARDAIAGVGSVVLETENAAFDEAYCAGHAGAIPGQYVLLAFSDTGCGMEREVLTHIFEPFFTTKEAGKGTGLGLATVYGIVKQNNGFVNVYSEPGKGTSFKIYLPRFAGPIAEAAAAPAQMSKGDGQTVLLVEDEEAILRMGKAMLEDLGYAVLTAPTPGEALRLATAHSGRIDVLLTDVVMPEMNGRELAERVRDLRPGIHCIYMSGYTADVIAHHGMLAEGVRFLWKPLSQHDLAERVHEALRSAPRQQDR